MYSLHDTGRLQPVGSPIRKSPDHRLLASPRSLSQLATSFFACLRQGIHTHALSSLTIKLTPHTFVQEAMYSLDHSFCHQPNPISQAETSGELVLLPVRYSVVKEQDRSATFPQPSAHVIRGHDMTGMTRAEGCKMVGLGRLELPTSPLSGVRSSHLSYRPVLRQTTDRPADSPRPMLQSGNLVELVGIEPATS